MKNYRLLTDPEEFCIKVPLSFQEADSSHKQRDTSSVWKEDVPADIAIKSKIYHLVSFSTYILDFSRCRFYSDFASFYAFLKLSAGSGFYLVTWLKFRENVENMV